MNRRDLLKFLSFGFLGSVVTPKVDGEEVQTTNADTIPHHSTNRIERYKACEKFLFDNPSYLYDDVTVPIARRIHTALGIGDSDFEKKTFSVRRLSYIVYSVAAYGDWFGEVVSDPDYPNPLAWCSLPVDSVYRIETVKGKLLEFQQSKSGPDYAALAKYSIEEANSHDAIMSSFAVRFKPEQIVHIRANVGKYIMYGTSALEQNKVYYSPFVLGKPSLDSDFEYDVTEGVRELVNRFNLR